MDTVANKYFLDKSADCLQRPIYYTPYLTGDYTSVKQEELKQYIEQKLEIFYEEVVNTPIVVFQSVLDHILRIDRVLRQPLGHCLLVGTPIIQANLVWEKPPYPVSSLG